MMPLVLVLAYWSPSATSGGHGGGPAAATTANLAQPPAAPGSGSYSTATAIAAPQQQHRLVQPPAPGGATGLLVRVLGQAHANAFAIEIVPTHNTMGLGARGGKVLLQGHTGVDVASALNWYLNDYANTTFDWTNYEVLLSPGEPLPLPTAATRKRLTNYTYYLNTCTFSYSLVWADFDYWQKQIDWMAMAGVNLPLALVGQEQVMVNTFARFNVSYDEMAKDWFSGPAFLTWFRMGNLQAWGGPLPLSWIQKQSAMQVLILGRMRSLGIRPVLSAFAGFIPPALIAKNPGLNVSHSKPWDSFNGSYSPYVLEPTEPLFQAIGKAWIEEQAKIYGDQDHIYSADTFTEMAPRSMAPAYLASASLAISQSMRSADPQAVWLCQSWGVIGWSQEAIGAYFGAVPKGNLMVLLVAGAWFSAPERDYFAGHPYIWGEPPPPPNRCTPLPLR